MRKLFVLSLILVAFGFTGIAQAYTLGFAPAGQTIFQGETATVNLNLGLAQNEYLGSFDIDLGYDSTVLGFGSIALGPEVGAWFSPVAGLVSDGLMNISAFDLGPGINNGTYTLATFTLLGQNLGTSFLTSMDGPGGGLEMASAPIDPFFPNTSLFSASASGSITVDQAGQHNAPVPEPSTWLLMAVGLGGLFGMRKKFNKG